MIGRLYASRCRNSKSSLASFKGMLGEGGGVDCNWLANILDSNHHNLVLKNCLPYLHQVLLYLAVKHRFTIMHTYLGVPGVGSHTACDDL